MILSMFLPEYLTLTLEPNAADQGKTWLLTITGKKRQADVGSTIRKTVPRDISALQFGKDLLAAVQHIHNLVKK